jgi:hypothetical protein
MPNIKILIKLFVLSFMFICCGYGDTIQTEVVSYLLVSLYTFLKMTTVGGRNM